MFIHEVLEASVNTALCYAGRCCQVLKPSPRTVLGNFVFTIVDDKSCGRWCTGLASRGTADLPVV